MNSHGTVLITGGRGFIGSHVLSALEDQHREVISLVRPAQQCTQLSEVQAAADFDGLVDQIAAISPRTILHLATNFQRGKSPRVLDSLIADNIGFSAAILGAANQVQARFVFAGSLHQFSPDLQYRPRSLYAASKQAFADLAEFYRVVNGIDVREVILADTYGPGDARDKLVPSAIQDVLRGQSPKVQNLDNALNLSYVSDVVKALLLALDEQSFPHRCFAVAPDDVKAGELVTAIQQIASEGTCTPDYSTPTTYSGLIARYLVPNWTPAVSLTAGLTRTVNWWRERIEARP